MRLHPTALVALLLIATALRLHHLDYRALWWDEGLSLLFARLDYVENARMAVVLADTNPPVYRLLLGAWAGLAGSSAFATRVFSVLPGLLTVALAYRLGRVLGLGPATSLAGTALCAASPILIYYAQEAKGYSLATAAVVASLVVWRRLLPRPARQPEAAHRLQAGLTWLLWGGLCAIAFGSHYIAAFFIGVEFLWAVGLAWQHRRSGLRLWLWFGASMAAAQLLTAAAVLPYVGLTFAGTSAVIRGESGQFVNLDSVTFLARHLLELSQGPLVEGAGAWGAAAVVTVLAAMGFWRLRAKPEAAWLPGSWVVLPIALGFGLNLYHEFFFPRFVLAAVPGLMLLVAAGIGWLGEQFSSIAVRAGSPLRPAGWTGSASSSVALLQASVFIVLVWPATLLGQYNAPTAEGEDWRPVADAMRPLVQPGDTAIYTWGWMPGYLDAYLPPAPLPEFKLGFLNRELVESEMSKLTAGSKRIWLLDYGIDHFDVRNLAGRWLLTNSALVFDSWPGDGKSHVALFVLAPTETKSGVRVLGEFANGLRLSAPQVTATRQPGEAVVLPLTWTLERALSERYTIFLHGVAQDGTLAFGRDSEPYNGSLPVTAWQAGNQHTELRGVLIPPGTAQGRYSLMVGMYHSITGQLDSAGPVNVGSVTVE